jgi:hypothetical protein
MPIDYTTDAGRVRLLIPDTVEADFLFTDEQVGAFLAMEGGVKKAAALALETVASSEVMVSKVIKTQDLSTDGAKVSDALLKRAASLRQQADDEADLDEGAFGIVDFVPPFQRRWTAEDSEPVEG